MAEHQLFYQKLGKRIRDARKSSQLTQEALGLKISLTRATVTNIEKGRQQLLVHTLVEIAKALDTTPEALLPEREDPSIEALITDETPSAQEWIRRAFDLADRD